MMLLFPVAAVLFNTVFLVHGDGPQCFSCSFVSRLEFCDTYIQCAEGEKCHVQKIRTHNGHDQFTSSCVNNQSCSLDNTLPSSFGDSTAYGQVTCVECCDGDMCNNKGCGDPGPPSRESRGPYCYQCQHMADPTECERLTICNPNEVCSIDESVSFGHQYTSGCKRKTECTGEHIIFGRSLDFMPRSFRLCHTCCSDDFCNRDCQHVHEHDTTFWSNWGSWSNCTAKCAQQGIQNRARFCRNSYGDIYSQGCPGSATEDRNCSIGPCTGCAELYDSGVRTSGLYTVAPARDTLTFRVVCDMRDMKEIGGWTVLQHRQVGNVNFSRNWADYVGGFGDLQGDFWLGLEYIHMLTSRGVQLIIDMVSDAGELYRYTYEGFSVKNASTSYQLSSGNDTSVNCTRGGYGLQLNSGHPFATYDRPDVNNCSTGFTTHEPVSGWWFWSCTFFNINGKIGHPNYEWGMALDCQGITVMLNQTTMKIK
ncbi:uncharacterized protein LOC110456946 [Mizuhopecten yessoensis]|uniref:Fibroleukin n=1 Tax=Mizuhopecten yessoensis TaxID=6573 RepID=A0A210Q9T2_MIZYE|nr:uncharacterized protein LOC110456946 [Mizuhopecten yessoensis]OWF45507.1 Fibroleukin [Mizuhopecten yessoensis]